MKKLMILALGLLGACSEATGVDPEAGTPAVHSAVTHGILWSATAAPWTGPVPAANGLRVVVKGRNVGLATQTLYWGCGNVRVRLFAEPAGQPVWDANTVGIDCTMELRSSTLRRGETVTFEIILSSAWLHGPPLPSGRWFVTANGSFNREDNFRPGSTGELAAGFVTLTP